MIPKIIHHTWLSGDPEKFNLVYGGFRDSWKEKNPDYELKLWDVKAIVNHPKAFLFPETVSLLTSNIPYINKSDLARFMVLWLEGGIYSDTDVICWKSFDDLLYCESFAAISYTPNYVGNAIMGSVKENKLMKEICYALTRAMADNLDAARKRPEDFGVNPAGVFLLAGVDELFPRNYFYPYSWYDIDKRSIVTGGKYKDSYAEHLWYGMNIDGWVNRKGEGEGKT